MDAMEEMIDEVDRNGRVIATHPRSYLQQRMFLHNVSLVLPMTNGGKLLLSRRAKEKQPFGDTWCCGVGGKAGSGENSESAALREMKEEIGKPYPVRKVASFVYDKDDYKAIFTIFTTMDPISEADLRLDPAEIQYSRAFSISEIMRMVNDNPSDFAPTFLSAIREFAKNYEPT